MNIDNLKPQDEMLADYRALRGGAGLMEVGVCEACGWMEWQCTRAAEPDGVKAVPLTDCRRCAEARFRAPEVYVWVLNVIAKAQKDTLAGLESGVVRQEEKP